MFKHLTVVLLALSLSACLKTRTQMREDGSEPDIRSERVSTSASQAESSEPARPISEIDDLRSEIARVNGKLEELERNLTQEKEQLAAAPKYDAEKATAQAAALEKRVADLEAQLLMVQETLASKSKSGSPVVAGKAESTDFFQRARQAYASQDYANAIELSSTYLKIPTAKHSAEATYLRAESYYQLKQYKKAIVDYCK